MQLRWYQQEAVDAINEFLKTREGNPCVELPTGSGKSLVLAGLIRGWVARYPEVRVMVLAHRTELVEQNYEELMELGGRFDVGIYAAGLHRRDLSNKITFAMIDSIAKRARSICVPDVLIIDEIHSVPISGEGKYLTLIRDFRKRNPKLKVVGLTATPYRMDSGPICHADHVMTDLVYSAPIGKLIDEGYLCKLRSRVRGDVDVSGVKRNSKGDFITNSLASVIDVPKVVEDAVADAVAVIKAENRHSIMFFCVSEEHCQHVSQCLARHGIHAPVVTAKTSKADRKRHVDEFKAGRLHALCNIDVYTTGFNARQVDCIVALRPTLSKGLWAQIVGRALRTHPSKEDALILDYGGNIERHGPIDCMDAGEVRLYTCGECGDVFSFALRKCPGCETEIPKQKREAVEAEERERKLHDAVRAEAEILGQTPVSRDVDEVNVYRHVKAGSPDSLRVEYRCGMQVFREWVCLNHHGRARDEAKRWWAKRFDSEPPSVDDALDGMFGGFSLSKELTSRTASITTRKTGKYDEIIWHQLRPKKGE